MVRQKDPIWKQPVKAPSKPEHGAAVIFAHGFDDDAAGVENIADQFREAGKVPHITWIFPNAPDNPDAQATAWYAPVGLNPIPANRPELKEDEDEDGMMRSQRYFESLISELNSAPHNIPLDRIVIGGFSQGCVQSLLLALTSTKYAGKIAGVCGLMGYLPLGEQRIKEIRKEEGIEGTGDGKVGSVKIMLARGGEDRLIPGWLWKRTMTDLGALGVSPEGVEWGEYQGVGHTVNSVVMEQMCGWLERTVPDMEGK